MRFEGIDALELHYESSHQPRPLKFGMAGMGFLDRSAEGEGRCMPIIVEPRLIPTPPLQIACPVNMSRGALLGEHIETPGDLGGAAPSPQRRAAVAGARLGVHGRRAARRAIGLEACLVDNDTMRAAGPQGRRLTFGRGTRRRPRRAPVAKTHRSTIASPAARPIAWSDKGAADVVRLMQASDPRAVGATLDAQFGRRGRSGVAMATWALRIAMPAERVEALCVAYTSRLLEVAPATDAEDGDRPGEPGDQP